MTKIVSVDQMKAIEAAADQAGITYAMMMDAAGNAVAEHVLARLDAPAEEKIVVLVGAGNNGGDGLVAAHRLAESGAAVSVYAAKPLDDTDPKVQRLRAKSLFIADAENDTRWRVLKNLLGGVTVLVDAVFGTGVRLPLSGKAADLLKQTAKYLAERDDRPLIVAVDCPSGLDCDTGALDPLTIAADATVTFAAVKRGQLAFPGAEAVGDLAVADIGLDDLPALDSSALELATEDAVRALLPTRPRNAHKGTFGRVIVAAGSVNYTGAAYLSAAAAYRVGAGLVTVAVPMPLYAILAGQLPEATWLILPHELGVIAAAAADVLREAFGKTQALLVGPGLGLEKETAAFIRRLLGGEEAAGHRRGSLGFISPAPPAAPADAAPAMPPLVVDADALKLLAQNEGWAARLPKPAVLTPHPGEMSALTGLDVAAIEADRVVVAQKFAAEWGHVVVLKGAYTVIAAPDGRATVQPFATAALARAGTGDVLAGAIAGLLAQGLTPYAAAVAGAYLHGLAGGLAAQALGSTAAVLAGDVLEGLIEAQAELAA